MLNSLWPTDTIWHLKFCSALVQARAFNLMDFSLQRSQMVAMASHITGQSSVCWTGCSDWQQRNIKGLCYCPFVRGIHRWLVDSPHKWDSDAENVSIWWCHNVQYDPEELSAFTTEIIIMLITLWHSHGGQIPWKWSRHQTSKLHPWCYGHIFLMPLHKSYHRQGYQHLRAMS